jgi:hypothetical protein
MKIFYINVWRRRKWPVNGRHRNIVMYRKSNGGENGEKRNGNVASVIGMWRKRQRKCQRGVM